MGPEHGCHLGPVQLASGTLYLAPLGRFLQIPGGRNLCEHVSKWLVEEMGLVNRRGHRKEGADTSPLAELRQESYEPIFPRQKERGLQPVE